MPSSGGGSRGRAGFYAHAEEGGNERSMRLRRHTTSMEVGGGRNPPTPPSQLSDVDGNSYPVYNKRPRKRQRQELLVAYKTALLEVVTKERDQVEAELRALVSGAANTVELEKLKSNSVTTPLSSQRETRGMAASNSLTTPEKEKQGRSKGRGRDRKLVHGGDNSPRSVASPRSSPSSSSGPTSSARNQPSPQHANGERGNGYPADGVASSPLSASLATNVAVKKEFVPAKEADSANHALIVSSETLRMKEEASMIKNAAALMDEPARVVMADVRGLPPDMDDDAVRRFVDCQLAPTESPGLLTVSAAQDYIKTLNNHRVGKKRHINGDEGIEMKGMSRFQQAQAFEDLLNRRETIQNRLKFFTKAQRRPPPPWKLERRRPVQWSYLLLEMAAMATDFHEERKWKMDATYNAARASGIRANASKMGSLLWATDAMVANTVIAVTAHMCRYLHQDDDSTPSKVYNSHNAEGSTTSAGRMEALETVLQRVEEATRTNGEGDKQSEDNSSEKGNVTRGVPNPHSPHNDEAGLQPMETSLSAANYNSEGGGAEIKEAEVELKKGCKPHHLCPAPLQQKLQLLPFQEDAIRLVHQLHSIGVGALVKGGVGQGKTVAVCGFLHDIVNRDLAHSIQVKTSNTNEAPGGGTVNGFASTSTNGAGTMSREGNSTSSLSAAAAASTTAGGGVTQTTTTTPCNENHINTTAAVQQSSVNSPSSPIHSVQLGTPKPEMGRLLPLPPLILCPAMSLLRWFAELSNCNSSLHVKLWEDWRAEEEAEAKGLRHSLGSDEALVASSPSRFSNLSGTHVVLCSHEAAEIPETIAELSQISWRLAVLDMRRTTEATGLNPSSSSPSMLNAWEACMSAERRISLLHSTEDLGGCDDLAVLACMMFPSAFAIPAEALKWSATQQTKSTAELQQQEQAKNEPSDTPSPSSSKLSQLLSNVAVVLESGASLKEKSSVEKAMEQSNMDVEGNLQKLQPAAAVNYLFVTCKPSQAQKQAYDALKNDSSIALALSWKADLSSPVSGKGIPLGNSNKEEIPSVEAGAAKAARILDALHRVCQWSEDESILEAGGGTFRFLKPTDTGCVDSNKLPSQDGSLLESPSLSLQSSTKQQSQSKQIAEQPEQSSQQSALELMEAASGKLKPLSETLCQLMERGKRVLVLTETPSCMRLVRRYLLACGIAHDCCGDEDDVGGRGAKEVWMGRGQEEDDDEMWPSIDRRSVPFVDIDGKRGAWLRTQYVLWRAYRCHPGWRALLMSRRAMLRLGVGGGLKLPRFEAVLVVDGDAAEAHELLVANGLSLSERGQPCDLMKFFTSGTIEETEARVTEGVNKSMIRNLLGKPVDKILSGIFYRDSSQHAQVGAAGTTAHEGKNDDLVMTTTAKHRGSDEDEGVAVAHSSTQIFLGGSIHSASAVESILSGLKEASWVEREAFLQEEKVQSSPSHLHAVADKDEAGGSLALTLTNRKRKSMGWLPSPPSVVPSSSISTPIRVPMAPLFYHSDSLGPLGPAAQFMQCYASLQLQGVPCAPLLYAGLPRLPDIIQDNSPFIPQQPKQTPMLFMPLGEPTLEYVITLVDRGRSHKLKQPREKRRTSGNIPSGGINISHPKSGLEVPEMWAAVEDALLIALKEQFMGSWSIVRHALETRAAAMGLRGRMRSTSACRERLLYLQSLPPGHNVLETGSVHPPLLLHPTVIHCVGAMLIINTLPPSATQGSPAIAGSSDNPALPAVDARSTCGRRFTAVKDAVSRNMKLHSSSPGGSNDSTITVAKPHPSHAKAVADAGASQATVFAPMQVIDAHAKSTQAQQ